MTLRLLHPAGQPTPLVASIPHGGRSVPREFASTFRAATSSLVCDWHTSDLYEFLPSLGASAVVNELSRWVADPNRAMNGRDVVAVRDFRGDALYETDPSPDEVRARVAVAWAPYHAALDSIVASVIDRHGRALLVDLHCFAADLPADIVIGDRYGTTASQEMVEHVDAALSRAGFRTARNLRWTGGWIVAKYGALERVDAVQLELNARTYVDPRLVDGLPPLPPYEPDRFADVQRRLSDAMRELSAPGIG